VTQATTTTQNSGEIDLRDVIRKLQANARLILAVTLLTGLGAFWFFKTQTPIYASVARVLSSNSNNASSNTTLSSQTVTSNPLPREAIEAAMLSAPVLNQVRQGLESIPELTPADKIKLNTTIDEVIGNQRAGQLIKLAGRLDLYGNGVYTLTAEHKNAAVAAAIANLAANELVRWDSDRILKTVRDAITSLEQQIKDIDRRVGKIGSKPTTVQQALLLKRNLRGEELDNARLLTYSTRGTLSLVTPAATPLKPVRPVPSLYAALAALVALVGSSLFVFLRSSVQKPVENGDDLKSMQVNVIGKLPRISQGRGSVLAAMTQGTSAEALRFVQVSLNTSLAGTSPKIVLVTSCAPGEGKSSLSASLSYAFASSGQNVLLIDADIHRPSQLKTWGPAAERAPWMNLESGRMTNTQEGRGFHNAIRDPQTAQVMQLGGNLHLMPSYPTGTKNERFNAVKELETALERWSPQYDMIIIDAPPALATIDAMLMAPLVSGVMMVVEARRTGQAEIAQVVESINMTGARMLGAVLNKIDVLNKADYYGGYGYSYMGNKPASESSKQTQSREPVRR
jgi:capsular exopolysaccharide synthesis family protein